MPKILIVSSDFNLTTMMEARLLIEGYEVFIAEDGLLGFQRVQELRPQLLVVDAGLSKMSGHQLVEKVKALPAFLRTPIIVIADRAGAQPLFREASIFCFFTKPVPCAEFIEKIASAVTSVETKKASTPKEEVPGPPLGNRRILLGGPHEFILKKVQGFFVSQGYAVEMVMEEREVILKAVTTRPDYIFVQLWEDRTVFNVRQIEKTLVENPDLRKIPLYVFCVEKFASEARSFIPYDNVIPFRESRDLLVLLERMFSKKKMRT